MQDIARKLNILAISGSLRTASVNSAVLRSAITLAPQHVHMTLFGGIGSLPHFNPDLDNDAVPESVKLFRQQLVAADGVLIACPEYAHGVPGAFKNAFDWVVASGELVNKPLALFNAAPRANLAQDSLLETLSVMSAKMIAAASVTLPITIKNITEAQILADTELCRVLKGAVDAFVAAIQETQSDN
jgi:chromate reductase